MVSNWNTGLTRTALQDYAPAAFTTERDPTRTTERYTFASTIDLVRRLHERGYTPVYAAQNKARRINRAYTLHRITLARLSNSDMLLDPRGSDYPIHYGITITNSHNGSSRFTFSAGLHAKVCSNGLVIPLEGAERLSRKHIGNWTTDIIDAIVEVAEANMEQVQRRILDWGSVSLTPEQSAEFQWQALSLRADPESPRYQDLLKQREGRKLWRSLREVERAPTLWNEYNTAQEILTHGVRIPGDDNTFRLRRISSPGVDLKFNLDVSELADRWFNTLTAKAEIVSVN